jgi:hypothetical protein
MGVGLVPTPTADLYVRAPVTVLDTQQIPQFSWIWPGLRLTVRGHMAG